MSWARRQKVGAKKESPLADMRVIGWSTERTSMYALETMRWEMEAGRRMELIVLWGCWFVKGKVRA